MPPTRPEAPLLGLPRQPLTPQQQLEAVRRMQNQAEQRVKLGMQLFKAVEARVADQRDVLGAIRQQEQQLRDSVNEDVAKSLQQYDQWIGRIDENFTKAMRQLEQRFADLERTVTEQQAQMHAMLQRAENMLGQARQKLDTPPPASPSRPKFTLDTAKPPAPASLAPEPAGDGAFDDKIYSHLLRRLRQPDDDGDDRTDRAA